MNPSPSAASSTEDEAALWAAKLEGSVLSAEERVALEAWLEAAPAHRELLSGYCQFSADLEILLPALAKTGRVEVPQTRPPRRRFSLWLATLPLAAAAALALVFWAGRPVTQFETIATSVAQRQVLKLADGSRAELNARTSLQVEISATERRVRLVDGQALFAVSKDPDRPFVVETPAGSVQVTGTIFAVRTESADSLEVIVTTGSVRVSPSALSDGGHIAPLTLVAGDRLTTETGTLVRQSLDEEALRVALAWRQGQVVFIDTPLSSALARFARHHGRGLTATAGAGELRVGGRFNLDDLDGFLTALEEVLPVRVSRSLNGSIQVGLVASR